MYGLDDDLALALRMADVADGISMSRYRASDLVVETKPDLTPVTEADRAVELALRDMLARERPADGIRGEEFGHTNAGDRTWILDPIDGTKNYVRGVPVWATLIGLQVGADVVVGAVSAPALVRRWWAARGGGAFMTEPGRTGPRAIAVSAVRSLADASLSISDTIGWPQRGTSAEALSSVTWRQRGYGDFWSHVLVAEGAVDVAAEPELAVHDMAALIPVVVEAGGAITAFDGGPALDGGSAVTTNGLLHDEVLTRLRSDISSA